MTTATDTRPTPKRRQPSRPSSREAPPALRISPTAWAKLLTLRDRGPTEVAGFGITDPDDPAYVADVATVAQEAHAAGVAFDDEAVADFFEARVDAGLRPESFARVWIHTHPGDSASPSATDRETFERVFGGCDWAVMLIVAKTGETHCTAHFTIGPGGRVALPVAVDYDRPFPASDPEAWEAEYARNVRTCQPPLGALGVWNDGELWAPDGGDGHDDLDSLGVPFGWREALSVMDPDERAQVIEDLRDHVDFNEEDIDAPCDQCD